ncbi:histidine kinase dimerization/phosphoacceptor domain -containing protein [Crocinitomix catalasitica]|uniref:histidine kinase dimerization/phosphoacceptor domain -containing protein n=1 Tax=Crocinitomix catalasitica TaxID=184607 RepID=UPI000687A455|nr:histidine kinase dimerization/phosphoacceptor domain -containing protein [Crocinitomix catalasitica]
MGVFVDLIKKKKLGFIKATRDNYILSCDDVTRSLLNCPKDFAITQKSLQEIFFNSNDFKYLGEQLNRYGFINNFSFLGLKIDGTTNSLKGNFYLEPDSEGDLNIISAYIFENISNGNNNNALDFISNFESSNADSFKNFVDNSPSCILVFTNSQLVYSNSLGNDLYNERLNNKSVDLFEVFPPNLKYILIELIEEAKNNTSSYTEISLDKEGDEKRYSINVVKVLHEDRDSLYFMLTDITLQNEYNIQKIRAEIAEETNKKLFEEIRKHRQTQINLIKNTSKLNALFESSGNLFLLTVDKDLKITSFNSSFKNLVEELLKKTVVIGSDFLKTFPIAESAYSMMIKKIKQAIRGESVEFINEYNLNDENYHIESFISPVRVEGEEIKEIAFIAHDISDKVEVDRKMIESVKEKEVLLKEVHHRVKNNLQVISSILNLQSSYVEDVKTLEIINESQNRIRTMAFIHESLYQTKNFSSINFHDYITNLVQNLIHSYQIYNGKTVLKLEVDKIDLVLDQAIPCGLIMNELVSNSLKHAYPNEMSGEILIGLKIKNGKVILRVEDDGIGLPENFKIEDSESLGLGLVDTLVDQLDGELELKTVNGTKYLIIFEKQDF